MSPFQRAPDNLKAIHLTGQLHSEQHLDAMPAVDQIDISFHVPFRHRLRFTRNVCDSDIETLIEVLDGEATGPARTLMLCESAVRNASDNIEQLHARLQSHETVEMVSPLRDLMGGEGIKQDSHAVEYVLRLINEHHLDRRSYIVAIGGGAFLDAVGYAAAIAHRGIRLVRLPTTTLAQADSGVGVKNAINYFGKKNWVGTFAVPWAVVNDAALLESLPDREYRCGFAEAIKVSALKDFKVFQWLFDHADHIALRDSASAIQAIKHSCMMHLKHITHGGDAFEMLEARPLDFGHWSAHRLEAMSNYELSHGEAVSIGVALDSVYSNLEFGLPNNEMEMICESLKRLRLPLWNNLLEDHSGLLAGLEEFREHLGGRLTVTMLQRIGKPIDVHHMEASLITEALRRLKIIALR